MGLEFEVKVVNMARDNDLYVCVLKPHGVSDKPLGAAILQSKKRGATTREKESRERYERPRR